MEIDGHSTFHNLSTAAEVNLQNVPSAFYIFLLCPRIKTVKTACGNIWMTHISLFCFHRLSCLSILGDVVVTQLFVTTTDDCCSQSQKVVNKTTLKSLEFVLNWQRQKNFNSSISTTYNNETPNISKLHSITVSHLDT